MSIHSSKEQDFVVRFLAQTANISSLQSVYIGLSSRTSGGGYAWIDDTPVSYTHWRPGFVTEHGKQCISIGTGDGYWYDQNCDETLAYICKMRKGQYPIVQHLCSCSEHEVSAVRNITVMLTILNYHKVGAANRAAIVMSVNADDYLLWSASCYSLLRSNHSNKDLIYSDFSSFKKQEHKHV